MKDSCELISYSDVISMACEPRHLLLGNGFSIACKPNLFLYDKLFDKADFSKCLKAKDAFDRLSTTNFEMVIRALKSFISLSEVYSPENNSEREQAKRDAIALREILVKTIAGSHPNRPGDITEEEYKNCRRFLNGYKSINTLNYDLLLYWALMNNEIDKINIPCDDGFRKPEDDNDADYVSWDPDNSKKQTIRYLHGALHIYDTKTEIKKFTWINTNIPLIEQIHAALEQDYYPVFVSEGTSEEKIDRIRHNDYLSKMYRSFTEIKGAIIVFGHSLDECDDHIFIDRIGRHGKTDELYISIFGDPNSPENEKTIQRALSIANLRSDKKHSLKIRFFDASSVGVWKE